MRIDLTRISTAAGDKVFMAHGDQGQRFAVMTVSQTQISGFVGISDGYEVPVVYPVSYRFGAQELPEARQNLICKWMVAKTLDLDLSDTETVQTGLREAASTWASFLGERRSETGTNASRVTFDLAEKRDMTSLQLLKGGSSYGRPAHFRKGATVDGFTALSVHAAAARVHPRILLNDKLDIEVAKKALGSVPKPSSQSVAWYGSKDPALSPLRLQAAHSYPVLAGLIAETPSLARAVDRMEPIQDLLTTRTGLGKASLKRLGKLRHKLPAGNLFERGERASGEDAMGINRIRRTATSGAILLDDCLRTLAKLPADRTPQVDEDWSAYSLLLAGAVHPIANMLNIPEEKLLEESKGSWEKWRGQIARAADFSPEEFDRQRITLSMIDALEALDDFSRTVVLPLVLRSIEGTGQTVPMQSADLMQEALLVTAEVVLGKAKSQVTTLAEIGRRYITRIPALNIIEPRRDGGVAMASRWAGYGDEGFPVLCESFTASNGLVVYPFRNFDEMKEESSRMNNCVGRLYLNQARTAQSHLFSVRSSDLSRSMATLEIRGIPNEGNADVVSPGLTIGQLLGVRNGSCPEEARTAVQEWIQTVQRGLLTLNIDEVREWRAHIRDQSQTVARTSVASWTSALGTDWKDEARSQAYWEEWNGIISSSAVWGDNPGALFRHAAVRDLVASLSPAAAAILVDRARAERENRAETPVPEA